MAEQAATTSTAMKRNFIYTAISVGSRMLVGVILFLVLARLWGPALFGLFAFAFSVSALMALVVDFGFVVYLMREVAAQPSRATALITQAFRAKLLLLVVASIVVWPLIFAIQTDPPPAGVFIPMLLAAVAMSFADFFIAPLRALGRFDLEAWLVTATNAVHFVVAGAVAWLGGQPSDVAWATVGSRILFLVLATSALKRLLPTLNLSAAVHTGPIATLKAVCSYGVDGMLVTAWNQLDVVAVRFLFGLQAVGIYSAGQKIVLGVGALATVVGNVMVPRLSSLAATRDSAFWKAAKNTIILMCSIGLSFATPLIAAPEITSTLLFGHAYDGLATLLPIFGATLFVRYVGAAAGAIITSAGLQANRATAQAIGLTTTAALIFSAQVNGLPLPYMVACFLAGILVTTALTFWWIREYKISEFNLLPKTGPKLL